MNDDETLIPDTAEDTAAGVTSHLADDTAPETDPEVITDDDTPPGT